jgi:hypothetical protein
MRQQGWGKKVPLDLSTMETLSFQAMGASTVNWDYWIDDVRLTGWNDACSSPNNGASCTPLVPPSVRTDAGVDAALTDDSGCHDASYPVGPYGTRVGDVIANMGWLGKTDTNGDPNLADKGLTLICLGRYRANKRALIINGITSSCTPCREQTKTTLWPILTSSGSSVGLVQGLLEGAIPGQFPTPKDLDAWASVNGPIDLVLDGSKLMARLVPPIDDAGTVVFPVTAVVRTDTMQITYAQSGVDPSGLTTAVDAIVKADAGP